MTLQAQPHECFDELVKSEDDRQRAERVMTRPPISMSKDVDADDSNDDPAHKICLRRETHASNLQGIDSV
jgi:hypothetical protein